MDPEGVVNSGDVGFGIGGGGGSAFDLAPGFGGGADFEGGGICPLNKPHIEMDISTVDMRKTQIKCLNVW